MKLSTKICAAMAPLGLLLAFVCPAALATASICDAVPGNLVANCGFELSNHNSWDLTATGVDYVVPTPSAVHSGNYGFSVNYFLNLGQTLATTAGDSYTLTFYYKQLNTLNTGLDVDWNGQFVAFASPIVPGSYTEFTFTGLSAVSGSSQFSVKDNAGLQPVYFDDFSVVDTTSAGTTNPPNSVPEPASAPLFGLGLAGIGFMLMMRRRKHKGDRMTESR